jgi:Na+/proline symporter
LFIFLGSLAPGALVIFVFDRELFMALDTFKLVLLALAITLPVSLINIFCASVFSEAIDKEWHKEAEADKKKKELLITAEIAVSFWTTSAVFYLALAITFLKSLDIMSFAGHVFIGEVIVVLAAVYTVVRVKWKARTESKVVSPEDFDDAEKI